MTCTIMIQVKKACDHSLRMSRLKSSQSLTQISILRPQPSLSHNTLIGPFAEFFSHSRKALVSCHMRTLDQSSCIIQLWNVKEKLSFYHISNSRRIALEKLLLCFDYFRWGGRSSLAVGCRVPDWMPAETMLQSVFIKPDLFPSMCRNNTHPKSWDADSSWNTSS